MAIANNPYNLGKESLQIIVKPVPSVLPRTSQHLLLTLFHVPLCISLERSPNCRAKAIISAITNSATLRELLKGELKTAIPRSAA